MVDPVGFKQRFHTMEEQQVDDGSWRSCWCDLALDLMLLELSEAVMGVISEVTDPAPIEGA